MRIAFLGSLLFSVAARCQRDAAGTPTGCVEDCNRSLTEHGLLTSGMESICTTPRLQRAHFQCLVNLCSAKSYGRAVVYSISICSATGANIIPLHPIEVRQSQSRKRGRLEEEASDSFTAIGRDFDLARNLAMALTCNAGEDGLVTVSLGAFEPSATTSILKNEDKTGHSPSTPIPSHEPATQPLNGAMLMGGSQDGSMSTSTDCESSASFQETACSTTTRPTTLSTLKQTTTPCRSDETRFSYMPTSTIPSSIDGRPSILTRQAISSETTWISDNCTLTEGPRSGQTSSRRRSSSMTSGYSASTSYADAMSTRTSRQFISQTSECSKSTAKSGRSSTPTSSMQQSSSSSSISQTKSTSEAFRPVATSDSACSSASRRSAVLSVQATTSTSSSSWLSSSSAPCTNRSSSSSSSLTTTSTEPCSSLNRQSASSARFYSGSSSFSQTSSSYTTSITLSITSSFTYATRPTSSSDTNASPAAYTFATSSLPPSYVPPLEEYGYGNPPPAYDFSGPRGNVYSVSSSPAGSSTVTSSSHGTPSSTGQSQTTDGPASYGTTGSATPTQMTGVASFQDVSDTPEKSAEHLEAIKVTLISSVEGEFRTTVVTIQQAEAASTEAPSQLALNDPSEDEINDTSSSLTAPVSVANASAESRDGLSFRTETPMPAMLVAKGVNLCPSGPGMIRTGFLVLLVYWAM